jgi:outer membrane protein TolC
MTDLKSPFFTQDPHIDMRIRVQEMDVPSEFKKDNVLLLVMRYFFTPQGGTKKSKFARCVKGNVFSMCRLGFTLLLGASLSISSSIALAASSDYAALVAPVVQQQPEALMTEGLEAQFSANQSLSNRWLSDSAALTVTHENDALTDDLDTQNWAMGVEFSLLLPEQKSALKGVSEAYQAQLSVQREYLNWLASGKVRQLVWQYSKAEISLNLAESALKKSLELQENVKQKVEVGDSTQLDLLMAEKFVLEQQALVSQKQGLLTLAKKQLQFWTQTNTLPSDITEVPHEAWNPQSHPKLRWMQSAYAISTAQLSQQKTLNKSGPSFFVGAQKDQNRVDENTFLFIEVSVPIGASPSNQVAIADKQQAQQMQKFELLQAQQTLEQLVLAAEQTIAINENNQRLVQQQNQIAQETLQLAEQSYQLGESSIQSLLLIQKSALEAALNLELASASLEEAIANANQVKGYALSEKGTQ